MKTIVVAVLVIALVGVSHQQEDPAAIQKKLLEYRDQCLTETGANKDVVTKADAGLFDDNDKKLQCFAQCFYKKQGYIGDDGAFKSDVVEARLPSGANKEESLAIIRKCQALKGADGCETAYVIHKCFFEYIRQQAIAAAQAAQAAQAAAAEAAKKDAPPAAAASA
ncbi:general odorant-binding protein 56d [Aethina tumida]|uniref:general odorant-binding protein 56d n=1 Tax=Aethina tumida TaxID=116153 RepID=UPI00096B1815|nr:general odorant-binding protein 56d [Aethina tumida]